MYKWRQKFNPPPVNSFSTYVETVNSNQWKHLKDYDTGSINISLVTAHDLSKCIIFVDQNFVESMNINGFLFVDGTFKTVPSRIGGYQLLTLMTIQYNHVCQFCLNKFLLVAIVYNL